VESAITPDRASFRKAFRALKSEEDGRELRADLIGNLKPIAEAAASAARSRLLATPTKGLEHPPPPLYATLAAKTKPYVRQTGKRAGVGVQVSDKAVGRFPNAARRVNAAKWRHPTYGRTPWVNQVGSPGWFSEPMKATRPSALAAVQRAVNDAVRRLERRSPR
jgi:hypothetical protein